MLQFTNEVVKDNEVVINGHVIGKVTDDEARYIINLINGAVNPTTTDAPTSRTRVLADACDVQCAWVVKNNQVSYTLADGKYVGQTSVRKVLNNRLRSAGFTYDAENKVWALFKGDKRDCKGAQAFAESTSALVSADEVESVRAKAQARAEKKANKGA